MKKRLLAILFAAVLVLSACSGGSAGSSAPEASGGEAASAGQAEDKPDTWIADRTIKGKLFMEDAGFALPADQINNAVAQKIKEMTGITLEWEYTVGNDDLEMLVTSLASGDVPDLIACYLDDSSRPEFPILLKGAREGMFTDLVPLMQDTEVYSKYLDPEYLTMDSYQNVLMRDEFEGKGYFLQMQVARDIGTIRPNGIGMYINAEIAESIGVNPEEIKSTNDMLDAARKIKEGGFTDANNNPVMPIGPTVWGGRIETDLYKSYSLTNGPTSRDVVFVLEDGKVKHVSATESIKNEVDVVRTALAEGLYDQEIFTMTHARAQEGFLNKHYGMMVMSNWQAVDKYEKTGVKWLPLTNMADANGDAKLHLREKEPWMCWAISSKAENPEEIMQFADFMASKEGKEIWMYGIEGETFTRDEDGKPVINQELMDLMGTDFEASLQYNLGALEGYWGRPLGWTDLAQYEDFGEYEFGDKLNAEKMELSNELYAYGGQETEYYDGIPAAAYISQMPEDVQVNLKQFIEPQYHTDTFVQACFADSDADVDKILAEYRTLLEKQGIEEFEAYLQNIYDTTPEAIHFY